MNIYAYSLNDYEIYIPFYFITNRTFKQFKKDIMNITKEYLDLTNDIFIDSKYINDKLREKGYVQIEFKEIPLRWAYNFEDLAEEWGRDYAFKLLVKYKKMIWLEPKESFTDKEEYERHRRFFINNVKELVDRYKRWDNEEEIKR